MKKALLCFGLALYCSLASGQPNFSSTSWVVLTENNEVSFLGKLHECYDSTNGLRYNYLIIKVENKLSVPINLYWQTDIYIDEKLWVERDDTQKVRSLRLNAYEKRKGHCGSGDLSIIHSFIDKKSVPKLTNVKITNLKTESL